MYRNIRSLRVSTHARKTRARDAESRRQSGCRLLPSGDQNMSNIPGWKLENLGEPNLDQGINTPTPSDTWSTDWDPLLLEPSEWMLQGADGRDQDWPDTDTFGIINKNWPLIEIAQLTSKFDMSDADQVCFSQASHSRAEPRQASEEHGKEHPDGEKDDNSNNDRKRRGKEQRDSQELIEISYHLFACPYFKHDPWRSFENNLEHQETGYHRCADIVLLGITGVKGHLHEIHTTPKHNCCRCSRVFEPLTGLKDHAKQEICRSKDPKQFGDRFTPQQARDVDEITTGLTEVETWFMIFSILFPGERPPRSPYVDIALADVLTDFAARVQSQQRSILDKFGVSDLRPREQLNDALSEAVVQFSAKLLREKHAAEDEAHRMAALPLSPPDSLSDFSILGINEESVKGGSSETRSPTIGLITSEISISPHTFEERIPPKAEHEFFSSQIFNHFTSQPNVLDLIYSAGLKEGEFRLLKLIRGKEDSELMGNLLTVSLVGNYPDNFTAGFVRTGPEGEAGPAPTYYALSHYWGLEPENSTIMVAVGDSREYVPFNIKSNLASAFRRLRSRIDPLHDSMYLWVDSVCINQRNLDERNSQVLLMPRIYHNARQVCAWLGESSDDSDTGVAFAKRVVEPAEFDDAISDTFKSDAWRAFCGLLKRPWFSRRWIVQELAVARFAALYCGGEVVAWEDFVDAISILCSTLKHFPIKSTRDLEDIEKLGAYWFVSKVNAVVRKADDGTILERTLSLEALMSHLIPFEAEDPRDLLYATLWLANDVQLPRINWMGHHLYSSKEPPSSDESSSFNDAFNWCPDWININSTFTVRNATGREHLETPERWHDASPGRLSIIEPIRDEVVSLHDYESQSECSVKGLVFGRDDEGLEDAAQAHDMPTNENPAYRNTRICRSAYPQHRGPPHRTLYKVGRAPRRSLITSRHEGALSSALRRSSMQNNSPEHLAIDVDYTKSVYEVCRDFLWHAFSRHGYIDMMCRPWAPDPTAKYPWNPPSWMVTLKNSVAFRLDNDKVYRRVRADPLVGLLDIKGRRNYKASGQSRAFTREAQNIGSLRTYSYPPKIGDKCNLFLKGFVLAEVARTGEAAFHGNIPADWPEIADWDPTNAPRPPGAFWRTLVGDRALDEMSSAPRHFEMACKWTFSQGVEGEGVITELLLADGSCPPHVADFLRRVQCVIWHRRLVTGWRRDSSTEVLGLAPHGTRPGDLICILYGCSVPVILRRGNLTTSAAHEGPRGEKRRKIQDSAPSSSKSGQLHGSMGEESGYWYTFIGECYVHGMMNGEALSCRKRYYNDGGLDEEEFEVR